MAVPALRKGLPTLDRPPCVMAGGVFFARLEVLRSFSRLGPVSLELNYVVALTHPNLTCKLSPCPNNNLE